MSCQGQHAFSKRHEKQAHKHTGKFYFMFIAVTILDVYVNVNNFYESYMKLGHKKKFF